MSQKALRKYIQSGTVRKLFAIYSIYIFVFNLNKYAVYYRSDTVTENEKIPKCTCYQCQRPIFALNVQKILPRMIGLIPKGDWGIKCNTSCRAGLVGQRINLKLTLKPEAIEEKHHCLCFFSSIIDFPKLNENVYIFVVKCF